MSAMPMAEVGLLYLLAITAAGGRTSPDSRARFLHPEGSEMRKANNSVAEGVPPFSAIGSAPVVTLKSTSPVLVSYDAEDLTRLASGRAGGKAMGATVVVSPVRPSPEAAAANPSSALNATSSRAGT